MGTLNSKLSYHEILGSGASGEVYRVTWSSNVRGKVEAAAKKIRFQGEIPEALKREIEYLKKLDHRNIIKYYDTVIETRHVVIVTEYAAKGSLYHYLKGKSKLPDELLHAWINHLVSGIDYLHQNKIAHRDLKSQNCVITAEDVLKICDFGISRDLTSTTMTDMKGTFKWLAPEVFKEEKLSYKSDIFAFAIIVWEMVKCEEPYKGMKIEAVMYGVCHKGLRPEIPANCQPFLKDLMEKCWHADRHMRPAIGEVIQTLYNKGRYNTML